MSCPRDRASGNSGPAPRHWFAPPWAPAVSAALTGPARQAEAESLRAPRLPPHPEPRPRYVLPAPPLPPAARVTTRVAAPKR